MTLTTGAFSYVSLTDWKARVGKAISDAFPVVDPSVLRKQYVPTEVKAEGDDSARQVTFTISTAAVDRDRDSLAVEGWKTDNFLRNPVVLWAHDYYRTPPVGQAVSLAANAQALRATVQFATAEEHAFADTIYRLVIGRYLRACSVGFWPLKWVYVEERGGYDFLENELREFSVCSVPANPEALADAKSAGIDLAAYREHLVKTLDEMEPGIWLPKAAAERALRISSGDPASVAVPVDVKALASAATERLVKAGRTVRPETAAALLAAKTPADVMAAAMDDALTTGEPPAPTPVYVPKSQDEVRAGIRSALSEATSAAIRRASGRLD
jgi:HK97 family phage prohead protease